MSQLPWTPDFDCYPVRYNIVQVDAEKTSVNLTWDDGRESRFDAFLLRENSPDANTIHPKSREMLISPLDIPDDLQVNSANLDDNGALIVDWSSGEQSIYNPGWLRAHAWFEDDGNPEPLPKVTERLLWDAETLSEPPSFNGPDVLEKDEAMLEWLEALNTHGISRLRQLPDEDGLLERVVRSIGPPRESNFGPMYVLEIKEDPDSNAFTSGALLQHMDMPTRESPHGLQFLYCRANTTVGGEGVYVDGFRIANAIRNEAPETFKALVDIPWVFNNRSRTTDYRAKGPVIELDDQGEVSAIRLTSWLRAPLRAPLPVQQRAYQAIRAFTRYAQNSMYQLVFRYEAGDLLAFDNRRVLHGRRAYDATTGQRYIEGIYADRDDLYSRIRTLRRNIKR